MQINSELNGDWECKGIKFYTQSGTRMANFVLKVKVKKKDAEETFGPEFKRIAFGLMQVTKEKKVHHAQDKIDKPRLVVESHEIVIADHKANCTPEIKAIHLVEGEQAAVVPIELPLPCKPGLEEMIGDLAVMVGEIVTVGFEPRQLNLPGVGPEIRKKTAGFGNVVPMEA
jgi:hypothetical protein